MTVIQYKKRPGGYAFNNSLHHFFPEFASLKKEGAANSEDQIPVNIKETESDFVLEFVAPRFEKEDFKIRVDKNMLSVEAEPRTNSNESVKFIKSEYKFKPFKRSFTLTKDIDAEKISAKYVNGVLTLNLSKKVEVKEPAKKITIE